MSRRWISALLALLAFAYLGVSWYFSNIIIRPDRRTPEAEHASIEARWGPFALPVAPEELVLPISGGEMAASYLENEAQAGCAVILLHGMGGTRWGGLRFLPLYWERGCDVVAPDQRGHGRSTAEWVTYGARERGDVLALVDWLVEEKGHSRERIGVHGVSMGGSVALMTASVEPELAFVAADSVFASLERIVIERGVHDYGAPIYLMIPGAFAVSEWRGGFDMDDAAPVAVVGDLLMPVFLLHPVTDTYTDVAHTRTLGALLDPGRAAVHATQWGADHADSVWVNPEGYKELMDAFLDEHVPGFGLSPSALEEDAPAELAEQVPADG